jgi:hypothetical protein
MGEEENGEEETNFGYGERVFIYYYYFFKKLLRFFDRPEDDLWLSKITTQI